MSTVYPECNQPWIRGFSELLGDARLDQVVHGSSSTDGSYLVLL